MAGGSKPEPKSMAASWRGRQRHARPVAGHRWQDRTGSSPARGSADTTNRRTLRLALFFVAFVTFSALFVFYVLFAPPQTALIVMTATAYKAPLHPNAWAQEDIDAFLALDGETLQLSDISAQWVSREEGLRAFDRSLQRVATQSARSQVAVIYISMHAAVDGDGNPCLIPTDAGTSPLDARTWLPVADMLDRIRLHGPPRDVLKLVILDCNRTLVNPAVGMLYNSFADRLDEVVSKANIPNLAVINSTSPGEVGRSSSELRGSVFGHFLQRGLAGEADLRSAGGDGNQRVSLGELHRYLVQTVDDWVQHHYGSRQRPMLVGQGTEDRALVWSLTDRVRERIQRELLNRRPVEIAVTPAQIAEQWQQYLQFREAGLAHFDPTTWKELQHRQIWLERTTAAGRAYAAEARRTLTELQNMSAAVRKRFAGGNGPQARYIPDGALAGTVPALEQLTPHSLPAAQAVSAVTGGAVKGIRSAFEAVAQQAGAPQLNAALRAVASQPMADGLCEVHFLDQLQRYGAAVLWPNSGLLSSAVSTRLLAERVAVPQDERVHYQLRSDVEKADALRRDAEDALFSAVRSAPEKWENSAKLYAQARDESQSLSERLHARDRMLSELPYLAEWLGRPLMDESRSAELDVEINGPLLRLIHGVCGIDDASFLADGDYELLAADFQRLRGLLDEEYARLLDVETVDGTVIADLQALLAIPLLPSKADRSGRTPVQQRQQLRAVISASMAALANARLNQDSQRPSSEGSNGKQHANDDLKRMETLWTEHPVLAIAESSARGEKSVPASQSSTHDVLVRRNAARGARLRELLGAATRTGAGDARFDDPESARAAISVAEASWRAIAPWCHRPLENDPVFVLRRHDICQMLLWHARRFLDDFYGPPAEGGPRFFELAAQDYINAARDLAPDRRALQQQLDATAELLQRRAEAARGGLALQASNVLLLGEVQNSEASVGVVARPGPFCESLPAGHATVFVGDRPGSMGTLHALAVPLAAQVATGDAFGNGASSAKHIDIALSSGATESLSGSSSAQLRAVALLRGNEFVANFPVSPLAGTRVDFEPLVTDRAQILLRGAERTQASVVFVLDCSSSMQEPMQLEEPSSSGRRFDAARLALVNLLDQLAQQENARVGVIFYGHRVGWNPRQLDQVLRQVRYKNPIPPEQRPYDDVETALPLGRFDGSVSGPLFELMESLAPWGETPLYLAMIEAARQFTASDAAYSQSIVVITDGVNNQFNPPPDKAKTGRDVLDALAGRPIAVHVVGFGIPAEQAQSAQSAFTELSNSTGGSYVPIERASELIDHLERLLGPRDYAVRDPSGRESRQALGVPVAVTLNDGDPGIRQVTFGESSESVRLSGGEFLQLTTVRNGQGLESVRYEHGNPQFVSLVGPSDGPSRLLLGVHRPLRKGSDVEFEFSLQHAARQVVSRPAEVWIEVTALLPDGSTGSRYVFYDAEYAVETPVPVLKWTAADWPAAAQQASVRFYCRMEPTQPARSVRPEFSDAGSGGQDVGNIPGVSDVSVQVHTTTKAPLEVQVVETYSEGAGDFPAVRIDWAGGAVPQRVLRVFDAEHNAVLHRFFFGGTAEESVALGEVEIRSRDTWQREALQTRQPVLVELSVVDGLIVPAAPSPSP